MKTPEEIVDLMMRNDAFSQWMGVKVVHVSKGTCELSMQLDPILLNGFFIAHGGISYSLSDSALAFASNSYGKKCVSIETSISHVRPAREGDVLTAKAIEKHRGKTIGVYEVIVTNQEEKTVALFKGTVHISQEDW
ncbi:MAG: PaaI family thioesterase [Crocinitomicaceae bacterium]|nr:PaaI family thioesterase [Crocinitomicaceae bacterium]